MLVSPTRVSCYWLGVVLCAAVVGKVRGKPALKMEHWKKGLEQCVFGEKQCDFVDDVVAATEKKREMVVDMTASEEGGPAVI